jgi:hypothetical protein
VRVGQRASFNISHTWITVVRCVSFESFEIKQKNLLFCIKEEQEKQRLSSRSSTMWLILSSLDE